MARHLGLGRRKSGRGKPLAEDVVASGRRVLDLRTQQGLPVQHRRLAGHAVSRHAREGVAPSLVEGRDVGPSGDEHGAGRAAAGAGCEVERPHTVLVLRLDVGASLRQHIYRIRAPLLGRPHERRQPLHELLLLVHLLRGLVAGPDVTLASRLDVGPRFEGLDDAPDVAVLAAVQQLPLGDVAVVPELAVARDVRLGARRLA
mmetsp:Transcript_59442/g.181404  ORF Transcript_59442/g.181404 Transcript_59442/m.181404 type:complete len:202 (+) Transcript_59442:48-653(+)